MKTEFKKILKFIKTELVKEYPCQHITVYYFILAILEEEYSLAYKMLDSVLLFGQRDILKQWVIEVIERDKVSKSPTSLLFDDEYNECINRTYEHKQSKISSVDMLIEIVKTNSVVENMFKRLGISCEQLTNTSVATEMNKKKSNSTKSTIETLDNKPIAEPDRRFPTLNERAMKGLLPDVLGNEEIYADIFRVLSKCDNNNVILIGKSGVGKTATVMNIGNLIVREEVPRDFQNKYIVMLDLIGLLMTASGRETAVLAALDYAISQNNYIFFVDNLQEVLMEDRILKGVDLWRLFERLLMSPTPVICTATDDVYNKVIAEHLTFRNRLQKIHMEEKTREETLAIATFSKRRYEAAHDVFFNDESVTACVDLSCRYLKDESLPRIVLDVMDEVGAKKHLERKEDDVIAQLELELATLEERLNDAAESHNTAEYDKINEEIVILRSKINAREKTLTFNKEALEVHVDDVLAVVSRRSRLPITKLSTDDRSTLSSLYDRLNEYIVGQEQAVKETVQTVKRQRVGITKPNKPPVMMFIGNSGTGKTYLAKKLAEEVYGNKSSFIRLDMSEYADKTSITKITGAGAGYIGYDNGGILTEMVKKNPYCVILLDEIEKAYEEVHNVFLQLFDEGRLTDNKGVTVDFTNAIIIMTSNVGTAEAALRGGGIGFVGNDGLGPDIIRRELKKKFKPEFINRIDNIIMFNALTNDDLDKIVTLELEDSHKRIQSIGYEVSQDFLAKAKEIVIEYLKQERELKNCGARPIIRLIQQHVEDCVTDYIITNDPPKGFVFGQEILPSV